jgi:hypothetical protein
MINDERCVCPEDQWRNNRQFCEYHQRLWCLVCDGRCPECRYDDPEDDDEADEE